MYTGRKRNSTYKAVQYLERADKRLLQHSKEMDDGEQTHILCLVSWGAWSQ